MGVADGLCTKALLSLSVTNVEKKLAEEMPMMLGER